MGGDLLATANPIRIRRDVKNPEAARYTSW